MVFSSCKTFSLRIFQMFMMYLVNVKVELTLHVVPIFMKHLIKAVLIERGVDQMKTFPLTFSVILNIKGRT